MLLDAPALKLRGSHRPQTKPTPHARHEAAGLVTERSRGCAPSRAMPVRLLRPRPISVVVLVCAVCVLVHWLIIFVAITVVKTARPRATKPLPSELGVIYVVWQCC